MSKLVRITTVPSSLMKLLEGQHKFMLDNGFDVIGISSSGQDLNQVKEVEGIRVEDIEMSRSITPLKDLRSLWQLYCFLKKERPEIVHTHTPKAGIVGMLASKLAGVPNRFHTVAGLPLMEAKGVKRKILNFVEKLTYSCATKVYPNSKGLESFILENGFVSQDKLKVIANGSSNGINTDWFNPSLILTEEKENLKKKLNIKPTDFVFIFVGRIVGDKGLNELVSVFDEISKIDRSVKLLLVGPNENDLDPLLPQTLLKIDKNSDIISVGFQKDVRPYFSIANALVFPSYREGFPNVVMQAGAMGIPSIVSDINGCNEIIQDKINGLIIPAKDSETLKRAMLTMLQDRRFYNFTRSNSRELIVKRYQQLVVWNDLLEEYRNVII